MLYSKPQAIKIISTFTPHPAPIHFIGVGGKILVEVGLIYSVGPSDHMSIQ